MAVESHDVLFGAYGLDTFSQVLILLGTIENLRETPVEELYLAVVTDHYVGGFDVSVDHTLFVGKVHGVANGQQNL